MKKLAALGLTAALVLAPLAAFADNTPPADAAAGAPDTTGGGKQTMPMHHMHHHMMHHMHHHMMHHHMMKHHMMMKKKMMKPAPDATDTPK